MKVVVNLTGDCPWLNGSKMLALAIKPILDANIVINQIYLRTHKVPPLYRSGVRYGEEPVNLVKLGGGHPTERVEEFACIPAIITRGWDDCDGLAPWRCAELREAGEKAKIRITWRKHPVTGQKVFHVLVRRGDGSIEDPSLKLGMAA